jgi:hypothetical protein
LLTPARPEQVESEDLVMVRQRLSNSRPFPSAARQAVDEEDGITGPTERTDSQHDVAGPDFEPPIDATHGVEG